MGRPWSLPLLTGTLVLKLVEDGFVRELYRRSGGLRFQRVVCVDNFRNGGFEERLVKSCSGALESIHIVCRASVHWPLQQVQCLIGFKFLEGPIDLSRATKLKEVEFHFSINHVSQVIAALKTITPDHTNFGKISIHLPFIFKPPSFIPKHNVEGVKYPSFEVLDHAIAQLCESHMIHVKAICYVWSEMGVASEDLRCFLPVTMTKKHFKLEVSAWDRKKCPKFRVVPGSLDVLI